ncbi:MAG: AraC family transcriptional regulator [Bacteroidota bacterium]
MKRRMYLHELNELLIESSYPTNFKPEEGVIAERVYIPDPYLGTGTIREIFFEGIHMGSAIATPASPMVFDFESDIEIVEMHFTLHGDSLTKMEEYKDSISIHSNQHNIFYACGGRGQTRWLTQEQQNVFEIKMRPEVFLKYLPNDRRADKFRQGILQKKASIYAERHLPITPEMLNVIQRILSCNRSGIYQKMYLESLTIELLLLQLEHMAAIDKMEMPARMKKTEVEKMQAVREFLEANLSEPLTLARLARMVGTNEYNLKRNFKALFGTTVFGYWSDLKMQEAHHLLLHEAKSVGEVSLHIGYKNPQHFSTAFKRKYGISPSQLKA